jgi:hypothetical protein
MSTGTALVVGNGESRRDIDLTKFQNKIPIVGCNAIHRDFSVDHLVCCDHRMILESLENPQNTKSLIYVRDEWYHTYRKLLKHKNIRPLPNIPDQTKNRADQSRNWGSGTYAHLIASMLDADNIYMLGFDLHGNRNLVNNIYKDTINYAATNSKSVDPTYWIYQSSKIFNQYPNKKYYVINYDHWIMPDSWKLSNVTHYSVEKFNNDLSLY